MSLHLEIKPKIDSELIWNYPTSNRNKSWDTCHKQREDILTDRNITNIFEMTVNQM